MDVGSGQTVKQKKKIARALRKELLEQDENNSFLPNQLEFITLPPPGQSFDA
jgi:hypothetical protein